MKTIDQSTIRRQNIRKILALLSQGNAMTRQELSEAAGLSLMTVTNLVDQLKEHEALTFAPLKREGQGSRRLTGRKADVIALNGAAHAWLVVDISGRQFRFSLLAFDLSPLGEGAGWRNDPQKNYVENLESFLVNVRQQTQTLLHGRKLLGVSVVTPGPYEVDDDRVSNQRLPELNSVKLKSLLAQYLGPYDYYVDEDVKFAVRAYASLASQAQCELLYYLYIGEGVGGAAVHQGNMLRGLNATAGDPGQLWDAQGRRYESLLSLSAFARSLSFPCGEEGDQETLLRQLNAHAAACPEAYKTALTQAAQPTAQMLYNVLWMLDPSHVIIDCLYAHPFEEVYLRQLLDSLSHLTSGSRNLPVFSFAPQEMSSVLRGAIQVLQREWVERIIP